MELTPLLPQDYPKLKPFFNNQPYELCTYSLPSILAWRNRDFFPIGAVVDNRLIIAAEFTEDRHLRHFILPMDPEGMVPPEALGEIIQKTDFTTCWFVPQSYVDHFGQGRIDPWFQVEPQPEYFDYVYLTKSLADLEGSRFSKKRNLINQFLSEYGENGRIHTAPIQDRDIDECLVFLEEWCAMRDCGRDDNRDLACEKQAVINALNHLDAQGFSGLLLRIDGDVRAFGIGSGLTRSMGALHFEKADPAIKGLYQYFDRECARTLFASYHYINKESDMGIDGLKQAKKSYFPEKQIPSYHLTIK